MDLQRCPPSAELTAFREGRLTEDAQRRVAEHVKTCPGCAQREELVEPTRVLPGVSVDSSPFDPAEPTSRQHPLQHILSGPAPADHDDTLVRPGARKTSPPGPASSRSAEQMEAGIQERRPNDLAAEQFSFLQPPQAKDEIGRLGSYRVRRLIGRGGMSLVFAAEDVELQRPVALKVMHPNLEYDPESAPRFLREARLMANIKHPHLVTIYQSGREKNIVYFAMELLEGQPLDQWLRGKPDIDLAEAIRIGKELTEGLAFLHEKGLLHRDIKPSNVWLEGPQWKVKILDLGLTRAVEPETNITLSGTILGTPGFMSPEQARGDELDVRSDLFSLGCVLYCLVTGKQPFLGPTAMAILTALAVDTPEAADAVNPEVPAELSDLIMSLLAKNPRKRPASARDVLHALERINLPASPSKVRPSSRRRARDTVKKPRNRGGLGSRFWLGMGLGLAVLMLLVIVFWPFGGEGAAVAPAGVPVYLTDLEPMRKVHWPALKPEKGQEKKGPPMGPPREVPVVVGGKHSPHGIFMHPPVPPFEGEPASITYRLGREFAAFRAQVSINDMGGPAMSPVLFRVHGDGKILWESRPVTSKADLQAVEVSVRDVDLLRIEVQCRGDMRGAHAVWVEPALWK